MQKRLPGEESVAARSSLVVGTPLQAGSSGKGRLPCAT